MLLAKTAALIFTGLGLLLLPDWEYVLLAQETQLVTARDDTATVVAGNSVRINVRANDTIQCTECSISMSLSRSPANGNAVVSRNSITYRPDLGFSGTDTFVYRLSVTIGNEFTESDTATVRVTVKPNAVDDAAATVLGTAVTIPVLDNDLGSGITILDVGTPSNGSAVRSDSTIIYTPNAGFVRTDAFTYSIRDSAGQTATATVTVTVNPPGLNAVDDTATTQAGQPVTIPVLANDQGEGLTIIVVSDPPRGSVAISGNTVAYTPDPGFASPPNDTFTYTIRDSFGRTDTATVQVTVRPQTLDAVNDTVPSSHARKPIQINVLANDIYTPPVIVALPTQTTAGGGNVSRNADNTITYSPAPDFSGSDTFTYTITDGISTDSAVVTVKVMDKEDTQDQLENTTEDPNAKKIGRTIGGLCVDRAASANFLRDCDTLIDAAGNNDSGVGPALEQITPVELGAALDTSLTSAQSQMLSIRSRMASLRTGVMGINLDRLNIQRGGWTLSSRDLRYLLASLGGGGPSAGVDTNLGPLGIFASGTFNFGNRDTTENQTGFDFKTFELTVGTDYRFTDQFILGAAFSYATIDTDFDSSEGYLDTRSYGFTLYGTYYPSDRFYIEGMVNYGWNDYDQQRKVSYQLQNSQINQNFDSSYGGQQFFADLGTGYEFTRGKLTFGPEAHLSYLDVWVDALQEQATDNNPGSAWAVAIDEQNLQSLVLSLGGRASYLIDQSWGVLQPQMELSWLHEFDDDSRFIQGRFVEGAVVPDNLFQLVMDPVDKDYFRLGLGLSARFNRGPSVLLQYRTLFGYQNLENHAVTAELRWEF